MMGRLGLEAELAMTGYSFLAEVAWVISAVFLEKAPLLFINCVFQHSPDAIDSLTL